MAKDSGGGGRAGRGRAGGGGAGGGAATAVAPAATQAAATPVETPEVRLARLEAEREANQFPEASRTARLPTALPPIDSFPVTMVRGSTVRADARLQVVARQALSEIPPEHLTTGGRPTIQTKDSLLNGWGHGLYNPDRDRVSISATNWHGERTSIEIRNTLHHEFGHRYQHAANMVDDTAWHALADVELARPVESHPRFLYPRERMAQVNRQADPPTARWVGRQEIFAESYSMYLNDRAALRQASPAVYRYMRDTVFARPPAATP